MKAVRKMLIQQYSWPSFLGKLVGTTALMIVAVAIPIIIVLALVYLNNGFSFPKPIHYGHFIDYVYIQVVFTLALIFAVISLILSLRKYWERLQSSSVIEVKTSRKPFIPSLIEGLSEILPHSTFKECEANNIRYASHLLVFWGMITSSKLNPKKYTTRLSQELTADFTPE